MGRVLGGGSLGTFRRVWRVFIANYVALKPLYMMKFRLVFRLKNGDDSILSSVTKSSCYSTTSLPRYRKHFNIVSKPHWMHPVLFDMCSTSLYTRSFPVQTRCRPSPRPPLAQVYLRIPRINPVIPTSPFHPGATLPTSSHQTNHDSYHRTTTIQAKPSLAPPQTNHNGAPSQSRSNPTLPQGRSRPTGSHLYIQS
jgi:hypothetical protein